MKITMYELLGMIKDGKMPKKVKYNNDVYVYIKKYGDYRCEKTLLYLLDKITCNCDYDMSFVLKSEVEIIEEKKIPDEININLAYIDKEYLLDKEDVDRKINEIINRHNILVDKVSDYLKSKGE